LFARRARFGALSVSSVQQSRRTFYSRSRHLSRLLAFASRVGLACTGDAGCVGPRMYVQAAHKMFMTLAWGAQVAGQGFAAPGRLDLADFSEVARDTKHQPGSK
jgi:hypothetical protein